MKGTIISLCDITGKMVEPWVKAGYRAVLVDPQHTVTSDDGVIMRIADTVMGAAPKLRDILNYEHVVFVAGFPPCTDVAVSGARWFDTKRKADPYFQAKAAMVAEQCRMIGVLSGAPWFFENPVSVFSRMFGPPDYTFHPHEYTGFCKDDNYTKKTCLWTGGGFIMPPRHQDHQLGKPDNRIHSCPPSEERANIRSATPSGFAQAVFLANAPEFKEDL